MLESIEHKFMVRGHSYLENDRDFALIEKRKKSSMVFLPKDWAKVIEEVNLRNLFKVTKMKQGDFKSWKMHLDHKYCLQKKDTRQKHCAIPADSTLAGDQNLILRQGNRC